MAELTTAAAIRDRMGWRGERGGAQYVAPKLGLSSGRGLVRLLTAPWPLVRVCFSFVVLLWGRCDTVATGPSSDEPPEACAGELPCRRESAGV